MLFFLTILPLMFKSRCGITVERMDRTRAGLPLWPIWLHQIRENMNAMVTSTSKTHLTEIVAGIIAVLGLGAGLMAWWLGAALAESAGIAAGFFFSSGAFALVGEGLRTGKMGVKGGNVYRDTSPVMFWGFAAFYILLGCGLFVGLLFLILLSF